MNTAERIVKPCPDGVTRHTTVAALDCSICHPEAHDLCKGPCR